MVKVALDKLEQDEASGSEPKRKPVPRKSRSSWLVKLFLLGTVLVAAAPSLISLSGQAPALLSKVHPRLAQTVSFRSLTVHWWTPLEITDLKIRDLSNVDAEHPISEAPLLCEIERATTIEPLWRIALNAGRGTGLLVTSPKLNLNTDDQGTNLDRTVTALFGDSPDSTESPRFPFRMTIEDGRVELRSSMASLLKAQSTPAGDALPVESDVQPEAPVEPPAASVVSAEVTAINGAFSTMDTERWLPEMKLTAEIRGDGSNRVSRKSAARPTRIAAGLDEIVNDFPDVPLEDLAGADAAGDTTGARIQIQLRPRADEKGRQTIQIGARDMDLRLLQPFLSMLGLDIACEGFVSGGVDARLAGASLNDGIVGRLKLTGDQVRIRQHAWSVDEWLLLGKTDASGAVAMAEDGILIQDLIVQSDVAQLTGSGELRHNRPATNVGDDSNARQQIEVTGSVDLVRLTSSLRRTLALHEDVKIQSGRVTFGLRGSAATADEVASGRNVETPAFADSAVASDKIPTASGTVAMVPVAMVPVAMSRELSQNGTWQLVVKTEDLSAMRAGQPLKVDSTMRLDAVGPFTEGLPTLSRARLTAGFGTIDCAPDKAAWKISGLLQPDALWQQLQQFASVPQPGLHGDVSFQSRLAMKGQTIQLTDLQMNSSDIKVSSIALGITTSQPVTSMLDGTVHVEGTGAAIRTLMSPWHDASWLSNRTNIVADLTAAPSREIQLAIRISPENVANVQRSNVLSVAKTRTRAIAVARATSADSSFVVDEADINLSMLAKEGGQRFEIEKGSVKLPGLAALLTGTVSVPDNDLSVDLVSDTTYDLDVLSRRLFTSDSGISFSGQGRDTFRLTGSPSALSGPSQRSGPGTATAQPSLKGSGTVKWTSAEIWGLQVGPASVQASLENSLLRSAPIQCTLNGGEVNMMPQYDFSSSRLQLGTGSRVQNLQVSPELCRTWLGYVAPMLADTAEVNGHVSARVERFLWDFNIPENSDVLGQLTIHQAQASPGSSLASMLQVLELLRKSGDSSASLADRSLVLPEQTVPVQIRQGYVSHQGLTMELSGYRMKTSGAVGLNKQLQMTIDLPLEKSTATASGRSVKIPLRGTISQPQPDTVALVQGLGVQKIQEKLGLGDQAEKVDKTLNKQLNKLFDKF